MRSPTPVCQSECSTKGPASRLPGSSSRSWTVQRNDPIPDKTSPYIAAASNAMDSSRIKRRQTGLMRDKISALTVKLRGRTEAPARRRGRTLSPGARGAKQEASHGPLQRLLDIGAWRPKYLSTTAV